MYASLKEIVNAIGLPAAMKLVKHFGGTRIYLPLPENIGADNEIARAVGIEAARKLARGFRAPDLVICEDAPLADWISIGIDVAVRIPRSPRGQMTERELARKYKRSQRSIRRVLAKQAPVKKLTDVADARKFIVAVAGEMRFEPGSAWVGLLMELMTSDSLKPSGARKVLLHLASKRHPATRRRLWLVGGRDDPAAWK